MTASPTFTHQTYKQLKSILKEFAPITWENKWMYMYPNYYKYDVYIYGDKLYTKISE